MSSEIMIASGGGLFTLSSDGSVLEIKEYDAIGCAKDLVISYIEEHKKEKDVAKMLQNAIAAAAKKDSGIDTTSIVYSLELDKN